MSTLITTQKPASPTTDSPHTVNTEGIGIGRGSNKEPEGEERISSAAFEEMQKRVQRRRRRSVDSVAWDIRAFTENIDLSFSKAQAEMAKKEDQERE